MRASRRYNLVVALMILGMSAQAQNHNGAREFFNEISDCATSLGGWKCLELDLSSEIVEESDSTKVYEYSWNFGDGTRKQGTKTEHCYEEFGEYQVSLDLIDKETSTVIRSELSATVYLYPEIFPSIAVSTENVPPSFMQFTYSAGDENFLPDHVYWRINGDYYEGITITHAFPVAGEYLVEVAVEKDMEFLGVVSACASQRVKVTETNVWTNGIMKNIRNATEKASLGPFASAEAVCYIRSSGGGREEAYMIPLKTLMGQVKLESEKVYGISLFAGSLFTGEKTLDTHGIKGNDLYMALRDVVVALAGEPFTALEPLDLGKEKVTSLSDNPDVLETATLLSEYPHLQVEVGSYLHTGVRIIPGAARSLETASSVREALVNHGVSRERISVASPEFNKALINTCSAMPDCESENPDLNDRVEFKITGLKL